VEEDDEDDDDGHHHRHDDDDEDEDDDEDDEDGARKSSWTNDDDDDGDAEADIALTNPLPDVLHKLAIDLEPRGHRRELVAWLRDLASQHGGRPVLLELEDD
jgi:hypothetical protein